MRNVHILPTEKPSKLYKQTGTLMLDTILDTSKDGISINQNIYITSDDEIKQGDWCIYHSGEVIQYLVKVNTDNLKKIILSTDPDLIADGVQAIDNEFLEWFVKNQSCESIKVVHKFDEDWSEESGVFEISYYKIILPQ
jgi:hypothetical protein